MIIDIEHLQTWVGLRESARDVLNGETSRRLAALLDYSDLPWPCGQLAPLAHWLHFLPSARASDIAADGHPRLGGFMPPVPLPRRMWAGGQLTFKQPLLVGETVERSSEIASVTHKSGKNGELVFVTVEHTVSSERGQLLVEHQDIVYRAPVVSAVTTGSAQPSPALPDFDWYREIQPDPVMLMRFSALTFNAHRIHYDRDYARDQEGYAGLVLQGPLTATLLMDLFLKHNAGAQVTAFTFKGVRPLIDTAPLTLAGRALPTGAQLWALDALGNVAMTAELEAR